jgi:hypothetical protein
VAVEQETDSAEVCVGPRYSSIVVAAVLALAYSLGNFFAYFAVNKALKDIPLLAIPTQAVMAERSSAFAAELYIILFFIYGIGIVQLYQKGYRELFLYALFKFVPYCSCSTGISVGTCSRLRQLR